MVPQFPPIARHCAHHPGCAAGAVDRAWASGNRREHDLAGRDPARHPLHCATSRQGLSKSAGVSFRRPGELRYGPRARYGATEISAATKPQLDDNAIAKIVRSLDPVDWVQVRLIASLPPERRIVPGMRAQAFAMSALRGTLRKRYPNLTRSELNMKVLAYFTPVRLPLS